MERCMAAFTNTALGQLTCVQGFEDMKVSNLIDPTTYKWDQNLLHGIFAPHEAKLIASIPLCLYKVEDVVVWPFVPSGCYTIKSGSKFIAAEQFRSQQPSPTPNDNGLWRMIWGLSIPNKVRNFLWKACQTPFLSNTTCNGDTY